jgi:hypothetical protein
MRTRALHPFDFPGLRVYTPDLHGGKAPPGGPLGGYPVTRVMWRQ